MTKQTKEEVANVLNRVNTAINLSQLWEIVRVLADQYGLEKVDGKYIAE